MIPILYESTETAFTSNGLGRLRDCISFKVTEERNNIFEADFEYPVDGAHFDEIVAGRIVYATHDDTKIPQPFDIVGYSKPISGVVTFHAVHISYRQLYLTCYGSNINSLSSAFSLFGNAQPSNPFTYEADFTSSAFMAAADGTPRSVRQMIGGVEGSLLDTYGGELEWDQFRVILHKARGVRRDFVIRYGVNMTDYVDDTDYSGTYSSCIPFWYGQDSVGQELTVVGNRVDTGAVTYNGRNDCVPLDLTEKFETKPTRTQLQNMARSMMQTKQPTIPSQNIRVDFVRLQDSAEYEQFSSLLTCNLCDTIGVSFPRYGMTGDFKIVRTVYDTLADRYDEMELGALSSSLSEALGITTTPTPDRINENFYVDADGNVTTNGTINAAGIITAEGFNATGHNSNIGAVVTGSKTDGLNSIPSASSSFQPTGAEFTLSTGSWTAIASVRFPAKSGGLRKVSIVVNGSSYFASYNTTGANTASTIDVQTILPFQVTSDSATVAIYAYQNSGDPLTPTRVYWRAIRTV